MIKQIIGLTPYFQESKLYKVCIFVPNLIRRRFFLLMRYFYGKKGCLWILNSTYFRNTIHLLMNFNNSNVIIYGKILSHFAIIWYLILLFFCIFAFHLCVKTNNLTLCWSDTFLPPDTLKFIIPLNSIKITKDKRTMLQTQLDVIPLFQHQCNNFFSSVPPMPFVPIFHLWLKETSKFYFGFVTFTLFILTIKGPPSSISWLYPDLYNMQIIHPAENITVDTYSLIDYSD